MWRSLLLALALLPGLAAPAAAQGAGASPSSAGPPPGQQRRDGVVVIVLQRLDSGHVLGVPLVREETISEGGSCCRYRISAE